MLKVGTAVVNSAVKSWLTSRKSELERESSLPELVQARLGGGFSRRRFDREVEALVDVVSERLLLLCRQEVPDLDDGERSAALAEVADAFERANLADADLFEVDVDPDRLARRLHATLPDAAERAGLSEAATWFHRRVLEECCGYYVRLVVHLTPFAARALRGRAPAAGSTPATRTASSPRSPAAPPPSAPNRGGPARRRAHRSRRSRTSPRGTMTAP